LDQEVTDPTLLLTLFLLGDALRKPKAQSFQNGSVGNLARMFFN